MSPRIAICIYIYMYRYCMMKATIYYPFIHREIILTMGIVFSYDGRQYNKALLHPYYCPKIEKIFDPRGNE